MNDETTPREGRPEGTTPEGPTHEEHVEDRTEERLGEPTDERARELELDRPEPESTQVLPQSQPTSELPTLTPEAPEAPEAPVEPEPAGAPDSAAAPAAPMPAPAPVDTAAPAPAPTAASAVAPTPGGLVTVRTGPRPGAILLGLLCLLVAAYTTARQTLDWRLDLNLIGPISIGVLGALLLLVGLIGLVSRRRS